MSRDKIKEEPAIVAKQCVHHSGGLGMSLAREAEPQGFDMCKSVVRPLLQGILIENIGRSLCHVSQALICRRNQTVHITSPVLSSGACAHTAHTDSAVSRGLQ